MPEWTDSNLLLDVATGFGSAPNAPSLTAIASAALVALFLGFGIAWIYARTHHGLSYSAGFTRSLVLITLGASLLMAVISGSLATAFGLLGALAIVRFRNVLKDTMDTVFIFFSLVLGMAAGTGRLGLAVLAGVIVVFAVLWTHAADFGSKGRFDGHLTWSSGSAAAAAAEALTAGVLDRFCSASRRVTLHDAGGLVEHVLAVRLRDRSRARDLVDAIRELAEVDDATLIVRDRMEEL